MTGLDLGRLADSETYMRGVAWLVLICFTTVTVSPGAQAVAQTINEATSNRDVAVIEGVEKNDRHSAIVERMKRRLGDLRQDSADDQELGADVAELGTIAEELATLDREVKAEFAANEAYLRSKNFPAVILERQRQALQSFEATSKEMHRTLASPGLSQRTPEAIESLHRQLQRMRTKRVHQALDPANLPFRAPERTVKPPRVKAEEFADAFQPQAHRDILLAATAVGPIVGAQLTPVGAEYLAPTVDVQINDAIQALAQELEGNPVKISEWVRNNVQYLPTYGSIQGSAATLVSRQGNPFDTASLLISLLRASGIPARYVYGTVEIPIAAVMNLAGNVASPQAALDLLAQGGIPVIGLAQGGTIRAVRMEHIWVEAFVDFHPSRGAKNRVADSWVPIDASFKKNAYTQGMQLNSGVAYSAERLLSDMRQNATLNPEQGWSSGLSHQFVANTVLQYQQAAEAFVSAIDNDATVAEILGGKTIIQQSSGVLAASLPYKRVVEGLRVAALPDSLRAELQVEFFAGELDQRLDSPEFSWRGGLPAIAGKRVTMAYDPATAEDRAVLENYADSSSPIPAYLVRVQPVLRIDGVPVARGGPTVLGADQAWNLHIHAPNTAMLSARNSIVAGTYAAVVPKLTTIMPQQFADIEQRSRQALERLQSGNSHLVTTDAIVGEFLSVAGLEYWAQQDLVARLMARSQNIQKANRFAVGIFAWEPRVQYSYGLPRTATAGGLSTDIDINLTSMVSSDGQPAKVAIARMMEGQLSSHLEGSHWALARNRRDDPNTGFSSSQIFQHLSAQGARSYAINSENVNTALASLPIAESVKADIRAGVSAGLVAFVNDRVAAIDGWTGSGYVIIDPQTGAGAYRINGGLNGGGESCQCFNLSLTQEFLLVMGVTLVGVKAAVGGAVLATVLSVALAFNSLCQIDENPCLSEEAKSALRAIVYLSFFLSMIGAALGLVAFFTFGASLVIAAVLTMFINYLSIALSMISAQLSSGVLNNCRP